MKNLNSITKNTRHLKVALAALLVFGLFFLSYFSFSSYKPKVLTEVREVKGYATKSENIFDIPIPRQSKSLAVDQTLNSRKVTFQTDKTPADIKNFYENVLLEKDWVLKKEGSIDGFFTGEYKKDDIVVNVWASYDESAKITTASLEILQLED